MEFKDLVTKAKTVKGLYEELNKRRGKKSWNYSVMMQGLVTDIGELNELIIAKAGYRKVNNIEKKIAHELSDCLWSIIVIADELNIDLESEFFKTIQDLEKRIKNSQ